MSSETDQEICHHLEIWLKHKKNSFFEKLVWHRVNCSSHHEALSVGKHLCFSSLLSVVQKPSSTTLRIYHANISSVGVSQLSFFFVFSWWSQYPNMKIRICILLDRKIYCVHKSMTFRWCKVSFTSLCSKISSSESHKLFRQNTETSLTEHLYYGIY